MRVKFINYLYIYNVIYEKKRDNFEFRIKTKNPKMGIRTRENVDIFLSDNRLKVYQGKIITRPWFIY